MSNGFKRILLAVRDVDELRPALLRKVAALASSAPTRLEVYHAIAESVVLVPPRIGRADFNYEGVLATAVSRSTATLERKVAQAKLKGVRASCRVEWDFPAFEAVLSDAQKRNLQYEPFAVEKSSSIILNRTTFAESYKIPE